MEIILEDAAGPGNAVAEYLLPDIRIPEYDPGY
jgi:hypothetical protein